ncbi:MAG: P27 family phage terminase small subunit [Betaproteobacteria bacterium]|nr:P27 family phage terminase small subunit [Betaproteobacteria bacterium]
MGNLKDEPQPEGELRAPPSDLTPREKAIWCAAIADAPKGLLRLLDGPVFRLWVEAWAIRQIAREAMRNAKLVVKSSKGGHIKNPHLLIIDQQTQIIRQLTGELGFSPASRGRITLARAHGSKAANKFANNAFKKGAA